MCLLERLAQLGQGERAAGERRKVVQRIEEIRKRQAQAYRLSKSRAEATARSKGREGGAGAGELGKVIGEVRRAMSVQVVRSQALCLLERMSQLGTQGQGQQEKEERLCRELRKQGEDRHRLIALLTEIEDYAEWGELLFPKQL